MHLSMMLKHLAPFTVLGLSLVVSGCSSFSFAELGGSESPGFGMDGVHAYQRGDYKTARDIFANEHKTNPDDPYALGNLADAYYALGDRDNAVPLYQQLVAKYKNDKPENSLDGTSSFHQLGCDRLKAMQVQDQNCPA